MKSDKFCMPYIEAEYQSVHVICITRVKMDHTDTIPVRCFTYASFYDNKADIQRAYPVFHIHIKHVKSDSYFVCDAVQEKLITTKHIYTNEKLKYLNSVLSSFNICLSIFQVRDSR